MHGWLGHCSPTPALGSALDQGGLCQCTSHLSKDKGWKILILKATNSSLDIYVAFCSSSSLPYNICPGFCPQLGPSLPPAAEAVLPVKRL